MRILFIVPWNPNLGCIKKWVSSLTSEIEKLGHKTYVLSPYKLPYPLDKIAVFLIYLPFIYDRLEMLWELIAKSLLYLPIALPLAAISDCIVGFYPPDSFVFQLFFKLLGKKSFSVVHQARDERNKGIRLFLWKVHYKIADGVIAISKSAKEDVEEIYGVDGEKVTTVYNGLNLHEFENLNGELKIRGSPAILYVGRLERVKGPDILIHALALIKKKYKEAFLHILGDGSIRDELASLVKKLGLEDSVKFYGIVVPPYSYMKAADILVIPSRYDALPTVALEGMACGIPIVVSSVGGLNEIITDGENGLKAKPEPEDIAEKVILLWENSELRKHIREYQLNFIKDFTWERAAKEYLKYMERLVK